MNAMKKLLDFLVELENHRIHFQLTQVRAEAVMVEIAVPGERWEVEFFEDGHVEVERFRSVGDLTGEETLALLFEKHGE